MTTTVLICDDSRFARRQMERCLPDGWDVDVYYAENGHRALEMIRQGKGNVTFLDLNMPELDGYETMRIIRDEDLPAMVIVVSGDVQPQARERMLAMGALDFISKPVDNTRLYEILCSYGVYEGESSNSGRIDHIKPLGVEDQLDVFREMANIAMGRAGENLANLLDVFIHLPIPNVNLLESNELNMAINEIRLNDRVSATSQGFISSGIFGEALLIFNDANFTNMAKLLNYRQRQLSAQQEVEALMDVSNILVSACVNAIAEQLQVEFSQHHPIVLGRHCDLDSLLVNNGFRWNRILAIEIGYCIPDRDINFDLLLLFPDKSITTMFNKLVATGD